MTEEQKVAGTEAATEVPADSEADSAQAEAASELHALLEDARSKADEHWNQCLRLQAELDNLRKRGERDLANAHKFALEKFAAELLPVKDSLEMGLAAAAEGETIDPVKLKEGTELTLKMLASAMEKFGIKEIYPLGEKFNPELHEAMSMQERDDVEPNTVVTVVQKGYVLNDRLIRPAMVIVSKAPA
ncbi:nucleotide exchange factor GrpE [Thiohalobacter sp. IOR34]|uniref:nucleotide exchange factor GrpE n=1 Tax=Thiohalobacter sp. IOR34 TaxID=3057176 RepID=UPI0025AF4A56|nr:nucleotide exchange factor GrpE [Thiohalobacter sp. IOR34]WJW76456.1 nucleotide exchange factor GrpE [Thiohalobacter sp. IOR34]